MANVFDVAKYILDTIGGEISTMKLQKLCYYSQGWSLAWNGVPLFEEDFEAWTNGPVCRELFDIHRGCFYVGSDIINKRLLSSSITADEACTIDKVIDFYGDKSGGWLSELTHKEKPWLDVWEQGKTNQVISKQAMKEYYASL